MSSDVLKIKVLLLCNIWNDLIRQMIKLCSYKKNWNSFQDHFKRPLACSLFDLVGMLRYAVD